MIQERELERLLKCPLLDGEILAPTKVSQLTNWVLRKSFEGKFSELPEKVLHEIRGRILKDYPKDGTLARVAGFRLFQLILDYEVIHLEQPYNLVLSGYTIQGQYALLRKKAGAKLPYVLVLRETEPDLRDTQAQPPDAITLARYVHVLTTTKHTNARVLQLPVFRGAAWTNRGLNLALAKQYLESMLKIATFRPSFPVAGEHCKSCVTKRCLGVFYGPNDDSWSGRKS